jgi:hypothetical protein
VGFESVREYEEVSRAPQCLVMTFPMMCIVSHCLSFGSMKSHNGFENPWQNIIAFKSFQTRALWFRNEAELNVDIRRQATPTVDGSSPFLYFDSATMQSYLYPSRGSEAAFCRRDPSPEQCEGGHGFDLKRPNLPTASSLEVKPSSAGEHAGVGLFAKIDIPVHSYIGLDELVRNVYISPWSYQLTDEMLEHWAHENYNGNVILPLCEHFGTHLSHHVSAKSNDPIVLPSLRFVPFRF